MLSALKCDFQAGELQFMHAIPGRYLKKRKEKRKDDPVVIAGCLLDMYVILIFIGKEQQG